MRKQKSVTQFLASLFVGGFLVTGCTNSDYDFNEIDATMGFGGDGLEIPASSTMAIPLKDVLDLEENGSVKLDAEGNYLFQLTGTGSSVANPNISPIHLVGTSASSTIDVVMPAGAKSARTASFNFTSPKEKMFVYHGVNKSVKSLSKAEISTGTKMTVSLDLAGIASAMSQVETAILTLPGYFHLEPNAVTGNGNGTVAVNGSKIEVKNTSTARKVELTIGIHEFLFSHLDEYGSLTIDQSTGQIDIDGFFDLKLEGNVDGTPSSNMGIKYAVGVQNITLKSATGIFDPDVSFSTLGEVDVTGVPDFLTDDGVVADLANPQILLTIDNNMDAAATISAIVKATKNGQTTATVQLPALHIAKSSVSPVTKICICRQKTADFVAQYGESNVYEVSNLSTLTSNKIPDHVSVESVEARADQTQEATIEFGKNYQITPYYEVYAPLAFAEKAVIEYSDDFDGWNDDIDELELAEGTYLTLTADAINKVPATLILEATPLDVNGHDISDQITVDIKKGVVLASTDGETPATSSLEVEIREKVKGGLKKLDGLSYKVWGQATYEGTSVKGITLNANKHTLKLDNIKIKLVGKVIGDFN